jgi:hypothetical protein
MVLVFWYWLLGYLYVVLVGRPIMVLVFWILASWIFVCCVGRKANYGVGILDIGFLDICMLCW